MVKIKTREAEMVCVVCAFPIHTRAVFLRGLPWGSIHSVPVHEECEEEGSEAVERLNQIEILDVEC